MTTCKIYITTPLLDDMFSRSCLGLLSRARESGSVRTRWPLGRRGRGRGSAGCVVVLVVVLVGVEIDRDRLEQHPLLVGAVRVGRQVVAGGRVDGGRGERGGGAREYQLANC